MEVGEPISPPGLVNDEEECPFEHDLPTPPEVENDLKGIGGTLQRRMGARGGTHKYGPLVDDRRPTQAVSNPKSIAEHALAKGRKPVRITVETSTGTTVTHTYPVSCAAHHCIPAQESLKDHSLLAFMCKKGSAADSNHGYGQGEVWSNVGYDVNGSQNGVFLPGNYAVGGGRGGTGQWVEDTADKENENVEESAAEHSDLLTGAHGDVRETNRKWQYVRQAVTLAGGQFHDRHVDYSEVVVKGALTALFEKLMHKFEQAFLENNCSRCSQRHDKLEEYGVPTPYGLVDRLNMISARLRGHLTGSLWPANVYTSGWMRAYMQAQSSKD